MKICKHHSCERSAERKNNGKLGYCTMHYQRFKRFGCPDTVKTLKPIQMPWLEENKFHQGDECLTWPFSCGKDGYGRVHYHGEGGRHKTTTASRMMLILSQGEPPSERHEAAHSCGNGHLACVNPKHLRWATPTQNQADRIAHQTTNRGERQGQHKLTENQVRQIRGLKGKETQNSIADRYGIHQSTVSDIWTGRRWGWMK